jgi:hypothetical protein
MSDYPNYTNEAERLTWGDFEIAVRTGSPTWGSAAGQYVGAYEIFKAGESLVNHSVASAHPTPQDAADNAVRVAKQYAHQSLDGPFPAEGMDEQQRLQHGGFVFDIQAKGAPDSDGYSPLIFVVQTPLALEPLPFSMPIRASNWGESKSTSECIEAGRKWMLKQIDAGSVNTLTGIWTETEQK